MDRQTDEQMTRANNNMSPNPKEGRHNYHQIPTLSVLLISFASISAKKTLEILIPHLQLDEKEPKKDDSFGDLSVRVQKKQAFYRYCKNPKNSDTQNIGCNHPKI